MDQQTVHLLVFDTLADWEPGYAIAGLNSPAFGEHAPYRVRTVGPSKEPVKTAGGVTILPDPALDELDAAQSAMLILPGGDAWDEGKHVAATDKTKAFLTAGVPVAAICGATAGLARAGVLDGRRHTSNAAVYLEATGYRGGALYEDEPAVTDGDLITAGATAPLEFAYHVFKRLGVADDRVLDAWRGLFRTGEASYVVALQEAMAGASA